MGKYITLIIGAESKNEEAIGREKKNSATAVTNCFSNLHSVSTVSSFDRKCDSKIL